MGILPARIAARWPGGVGPPLVAGLVGALLFVVVWGQYRAAEGHEALYHLFYERAVADTCALISRPVELGFRLERDRRAVALGIGPADLRDLRLQGLVAADLEWLNRGLGGNRAWCRGEGMAAVRRFTGAWCAARPRDQACR